MNHLSTEETVRLHPWTEGGEVDAPGLESWVQGRLAWQRQQIERLLAVEGQKTLDNTLRPYDDVVATLRQNGMTPMITSRARRNRQTNSIDVRAADLGRTSHYPKAAGAPGRTTLWHRDCGTRRCGGCQRQIVTVRSDFRPAVLSSRRRLAEAN